MHGSKRVLVPVANGSEEIEAVIIIDVLRRAGAEATVAAVGTQTQVECSRGVKLVADRLIEDCAEDEYDVIALPGGMPGAEHLRDSDVLISMLRKQQESARIVAAICASPAVVLETHGLLAGGKKATSHPGFSQHLSNQSLVNQRVVIDGNIITSRGPGTAFEFALALVKVLYGEDTMKKVAQPMVMYEGWDSSI